MALQNFGLTVAAMIAFAANSLLCRAALLDTQIDPASFTFIRISSGVIALGLLCLLKNKKIHTSGNWFSGAALMTYAAGFSFAYVSLPAATGALLLFVAVQITMIGWGLYRGERLGSIQWVGFVAAFAGLIALLLPGLSAPSISGSCLMILAGIGWGVYSLLGRGVGDPTLVTAGNFLKAVPFALFVSLCAIPWFSVDSVGLMYALCSGAITSGMGYAIWYAALRYINATTAGTVQLSVPVLAAIGGMIFLAEPISLRFVISSLCILGGIALVVIFKSSHQVKHG